MSKMVYGRLLYLCEIAHIDSDYSYTPYKYSYDVKVLLGNNSSKFIDSKSKLVEFNTDYIPENILYYEDGKIRYHRVKLLLQVKNYLFFKKYNIITVLPEES